MADVYICNTVTNFRGNLVNRVRCGSMANASTSPVKVFPASISARSAQIRPMLTGQEAERYAGTWEARIPERPPRLRWRINHSSHLDDEVGDMIASIFESELGYDNRDGHL